MSHRRPALVARRFARGSHRVAVKLFACRNSARRSVTRCLRIADSARASARACETSSRRSKASTSKDERDFVSLEILPTSAAALAIMMSLPRKQPSPHSRAVRTPPVPPPDPRGGSRTPRVGTPRSRSYPPARGTDVPRGAPFPPTTRACPARSRSPACVEVPAAHGTQCCDGYRVDVETPTVILPHERVPLQEIR